MKILNKEIEFDFFDAVQMEKFEEETEKTSKKINKLDIKNMKQSEFINQTCTIIEECFDNIFGEGISKEIFQKDKNFRLCIKAFKDLVKARKEQEVEIGNEVSAFQKELEEIGAEYKPNRATRRAKK